jgi:hypothetical protein
MAIATAMIAGKSSHPVLAIRRPQFKAVTG